MTIYKALREFKQNNDITIRKADKTNSLVIMDTTDYLTKVNSILSDSSKFSKLKKNPTEDIKRKINRAIEVINAEAGPHHLATLEGHYTPGYIYGNPKIHKDVNNPPIRPIISQIGTPVYDVAKYINSVIVKYMPKQYMINSTNEFVNICKTIDSPTHMVSLDVESLFTNVPVDDTIEIILNHVYNNDLLRKPNIPKVIMKRLLKTCTTECPFYSPTGEIYVQKDGISMGTPLGPTFANYYMCELENNAFATLSNKPKVYCRYVDDCFLMIDNIDQLHRLKKYFEDNSVLKFTTEFEINKKLPFLDVLLSRENHQLHTSVYRKATNIGDCLNYNSICPDQYKEAVIKTFLHRAYNI